MTYANAALDEQPRIVSWTPLSEPEKKPDEAHSHSYTGDQRWRVKSELWKTFSECNNDNWDGYGAIGVAPDVFAVAFEFLQKLPNFIANPEVAADPDGEISFEWFNRQDFILTVSVSPERKIAYAGIFGQERIHGIENFGMDIPQIVLAYLSRYFGNVVPIFQS